MPWILLRFLLIDESLKMAVVEVILGLVRTIVFIYDVVTYPVYYMVQTPWKERSKQYLGQTKCLAETNDLVSYLRDKGDSPIYKEIIINAKVDTMAKAFEYAVRKYGNRDALGTREILDSKEELQDNGKMFKKLALGEYQWLNYNQVHATSISFGAGLRTLGLSSGSVIGMYAETRAEWMMSCQGAFSQNIALATVYTNLGDEAVLHALNETEVSVVVTSHELLPKFKGMIEKLQHVRTLVVMEDQLEEVDVNMFGNHPVTIIPFRSLVVKGADALAVSNDLNGIPPEPESTAIIMYTSGSTGTPKGVVLTHKNLVATMCCIMFMLHPKETDIYLAFLPLAHVLELLSENTMMVFGIRVGYSNPNTMTDMSTKVMSGYKGDASVLKPTMMCAVPLILDRIYKNVVDSVKKKGHIFEKVFKLCFDYKLSWYKAGVNTPICDRIVFSKIQALLGGNMHFVIVGGAPLNAKTHDFIRTCLGAIIVPGYSLTESCCTGSVMENSDLSCGTVGRPMTGVEVRLVDWEEGSYKVTDRPNPRGEIILGGNTIAKGYFKLPDLTNECFFEEGGKRWFRTGDIGEFDKNGSLRIIDRKKDLVKLQLGEYVSLGKVEAILKAHPLVEQICVYGDPNKSFIVALAMPSRINLETMAHKMGKTSKFEDLLEDREVEGQFLKELELYSLNGKLLEKFEFPHAVTLVSEQWTPESGFITASFKMKRKVIQSFYQRQIDSMYG